MKQVHDSIIIRLTTLRNFSKNGNSGILLLLNSTAFCMQRNDLPSFRYQTRGLSINVTDMFCNGLA